jgi:hypothetical protein
VYLNAGTASQPAVFPLPFTDLFYAQAFLGIQTFNIFFTVGKINMYASEDASSFTGSGGKSWQYRYVIIPGGVNIGGRQKGPVDFNNYEAVKQYYKIPD